MSYTAAIIALSDNALKGRHEDISGDLIREKIGQEGFDASIQLLLGDDSEELKKALIDICDNKRANLVLTSGGTGLSKQDTTPEATLAVIERQVPGISEAIRAESMKYTPRGMFYRGVSGIRGETLIVNLPGSPRAIREIMDVILPVLSHAVKTVCSEND